MDDTKHKELVDAVEKVLATANRMAGILTGSGEYISTGTHGMAFLSIAASVLQSLAVSEDEAVLFLRAVYTEQEKKDKSVRASN